MTEYEAANAIMIVGGGASAIIAALLVVRKMWLDFLSAKTETYKSGAEISVVTLLRQEIDRLTVRLEKFEEKYKTDIAAIQSIHTQERETWQAKMAALELRIAQLSEDHASVKQSALDAYVFVTSHPHYYDKAIYEELKKRLLFIVVHNEVDDESTD